MKGKEPYQQSQPGQAHYDRRFFSQGVGVTYQSGDTSYGPQDAESLGLNGLPTGLISLKQLQEYKQQPGVGTDGYVTIRKK